MYSFSQNFEDVYIRRAFSDVGDGFYIDAGAYDPVVDSVTKMLYDIGWSGINLEPGPSIATFASRTRDINLAVALGPAAASRPYLYNVEDPGTSRVLADDSASEMANGIRRYEVPVLSLGDIIEAHARDRHIHFLKLDIEGGEWDVLRTTDWRRIRPELIVAECTLPYTNDRRDKGWANHMARFGYAETFFDGINAYYLREESAHRGSAFNRPVNVLDGVRKFDPVQHGAALAGVARAESAANAEALRIELKAAQTVLDHQARAHEDHLAMIASLAATIAPQDDPDDRPVEQGNSAESQILELARRIEQLKVARDDLVADSDRQSRAAEARADALAEQLASAQADAADIPVLKSKLVEARRSRERMVEVMLDLATREKAMLQDAVAEQARSHDRALEHERDAAHRAHEHAEWTRRDTQSQIERAEGEQRIVIDRLAAVEAERATMAIRLATADAERRSAADMLGAVEAQRVAIAEKLAVAEGRIDLQQASAERDFHALVSLGAIEDHRIRPQGRRRMLDLRSRAIIREADALRDRGDPAGAARAYARAYEQFPERVDLCVQLANALKDSGEMAAAEQAYREALTRFPRDPDIFLQLGGLYVMSGRIPLARMAFRRSIELSSGDTPAALELKRLDDAN